MGAGGEEGALQLSCERGVGEGVTGAEAQGQEQSVGWVGEEEWGGDGVLGLECQHEMDRGYEIERGSWGRAVGWWAGFLHTGPFGGWTLG